MIKTLIYRIIGPTTFFRIKRVLNKIRSRKPNCSSNRKMSVYSKGYHTTCGYYDLDPEQNGKLLYGCANRDMTSYDIVLQDLRDGSINIIDTTKNHIRRYYKSIWIKSCFAELLCESCFNIS